MNKFKKNHSFTKRKEESSRIMEKYENRVPVIVEKDQKSDLKDMDKLTTNNFNSLFSMHAN